MTTKPKRDPEKELFRRKVIEKIMTAILLVILGIALLYAGIQVFQMGHAMIVKLSEPEMKPARDMIEGILTASVVIGGTVGFLFAIVGYATWNEERMEKLEKIIEREDGNHD